MQPYPYNPFTAPIPSSYPFFNEQTPSSTTANRPTSSSSESSSSYELSTILSSNHSNPFSITTTTTNNPSSLPIRSEQFDLSSLIEYSRYRREHYNEHVLCNFCKCNGENYEVYTSHKLRDNARNVTLCPILRSYQCPMCGESGDQAHTRKYCAMGNKQKKLRKIQQAMATKP
ncbi:unnamed protein product [Didymodactylos carnosus]|uniref:Nanos-type domain-containing protein n=1 Tax=Didymodactylos carnosus TaxID=1234261 RepID=A0A8S2F0F5_9BILA|nr:unnamed protein product [Didymodactylos carnosus]CAF4093386.1 unnamed protein product [Didymodactylos carnosus]